VRLMNGFEVGKREGGPRTIGLEPGLDDGPVGERGHVS
jgi:hypothetical protein